MRADHSRHHFFAWIATASAVASRLHAYVSPAATMASPPESKGASALLVSPGTRSTSETGTPSVVDGTRTAVDSNPTSGAPRTLAPSPTTPGGLLSVTSGPPASGSANPGQHLVTTPRRDDRPVGPLNRRLRWRDSSTHSGPARQAPSLQTHATPWTTTPSNATPPAATRAAATAPSVTRPPTTPLVATSLSATNLVATDSSRQNLSRRRCSTLSQPCSPRAAQSVAGHDC